jgi:MarR family 2-MHQ and catechol resistance regulon transcriptional repressor
MNTARKTPARRATRAAPAAVPAAHADDLKLFVVLSRAHEAVTRHAAADVVRHGLTLQEFAILEVLYHKGPLLLGEVQRRILVSSGGITFLVDRLQAKGLVERRTCEEDRRARYAVLTKQGEALIRRIFPEHAERISRSLSGLSKSDRETATRLLKALGRAAAELEHGPGTD